jgi:uncharacterized membrane protein YbhN (UPF0104 family)
MQRKHLARLSTVVGIGLGVAAVAFVVRFLARDWDEVSDSLADARPGWVLAAFAVAALAMTAIAVPWRTVLRVLGGELPLSEVIARYYVGEIGKYLPGGLWPVVGRGELAARGGVPRTAAYGSVALSLALLYLAAMFVVLVSVPFMIAAGGSLRYLWVLVVLPMGLAVLHHSVLERVRATASRLTGREINLVIPAWRDSLTILVSYIPSWLFVGTATWLVSRGLGADAGWVDIAPAAVQSWVVGFVLIPVPGGVGVREAAFLAAASSTLEPGVAAAVALVARVLFVLVDAGGFILGSAWLTHRRGDTRPEPAPATAEPTATTPSSSVSGTPDGCNISGLVTME